MIISLYRKGDVLPYIPLFANTHERADRIGLSYFVVSLEEGKWEKARKSQDCIIVRFRISSGYFNVSIILLSSFLPYVFSNARFSSLNVILNIIQNINSDRLHLFPVSLRHWDVNPWGFYFEYNQFLCCNNMAAFYTIVFASFNCSILKCLSLLIQSYENCTISRNA